MTNSAKHYSWSAISQFGTQAISFLGNILIAKILTPDDYGLVAMLAIFIGISMSFAESGFGDCLIRKKNADELDYSTIFVYNFIVGILCYLILFFLSDYISLFYGRSELTEITKLIGLSIILRALTVTEITRLRKNLEYKKLSIVLIISALLSVIVGYVFAKSGYGYESLVFQIISQPLFQLILFFLVCKWKPSFKFSLERFREMNKYAYHIMIAYFVNQIGSNLYSLFIGKAHSTSNLGLFSQASKLNDAIFKGFNGVVMTTSYTIIAKEENTSKRNLIFESTLNYFLFFHFFVSFFLIGSASEIIQILLGEKWLGSVPYFQLLTVSFFLQPLVLINANMANLIGKSNVYRNLTFLRNGLILFVLLLTFRYSIEVIILCQIATRFISALIDSIICGNFGGMKAQRQMKILGIQLIVPMVSLIISYYITMNISDVYLKFILYSLGFTLFYLIGNNITKNKVQTLLIKKIIK